jgi:hypothetical protein
LAGFSNWLIYISVVCRKKSEIGDISQLPVLKVLDFNRKFYVGLEWVGGWGGSGQPAEMGNKSGNFCKSINTDIIIRLMIFSQVNAICF